MKTYQDLLEIGENESARQDFVRQVINDHKSSNMYREASIAYDYAKHKNVTISQYQKLLYTVSGKAVPDNYNANWKMASNFFFRFVTQEAQYLLGNGITWKNRSTADKVGEDFETQ